MREIRSLLQIEYAGDMSWRTTPLFTDTHGEPGQGSAGAAAAGAAAGAAAAGGGGGGGGGDAAATAASAAFSATTSGAGSFFPFGGFSFAPPLWP